MRLSRLSRFVAAVFALALVLPTTPVHAQTEVHYVAVPEAIAAYWTPERMANAQPAMPVLEGPSNLSAVLPEASFGPPGAALSGSGGAYDLVNASEADLLSFAGASAEFSEMLQPESHAYAYPPPEDTWPVPLSWYGSYPLRTVGKVFFTQGGLNYVCSGSSIGNRAVLAAGHCVSDGAGSFSTNVMFRPASRPSWIAPYGTWAAYSLRVMTAWHTSENFCRDVGFFSVSDINGVKLSSRIGWLGHAWNQSRVQHFTALGYPAAAPWNGSIMVLTDASYAHEDSPGCTPNTTGIGTRQTPGSSGGPWVITYRPQQAGASNYANGVFSYFYTGEPRQLFSPYFDQEVKDAIDLALAD